MRGVGSKEREKEKENEKEEERKRERERNGREGGEKEVNQNRGTR